MDTLRSEPAPAARFCFACSQRNPVGLKLQPVYDGEKVTAVFMPGEFHQGWNGVVHGGILYTLLDEVNAYAMLCQGIEFGVTAQSEIRFKQLAPINEPMQACAWVTKLTKRLVETKGTIILNNDTVVAEADFLFYVWKQSQKAVLWDMDGVIADSSSFHFAAWQETFAKRGVKFTKQDFRTLFGARNDFIIASVMGKRLPVRDVKMMAKEKEKSFRRRAAGNIKPFPGVIKLLNAIKKGNFKLALVSSAARENIDFVVQELGLEGMFDCVVFGQEVAEAKPSPQIYLLAAEKLGVRPGDCLVIEDSPFGIKAAKAAGMKCLAVGNSYPRGKLMEADRVVNSLESVDLITLLTKV